MNHEQAFDIYCNRDFPENSRSFQEACRILWNYVLSQAEYICRSYRQVVISAEEITSILLMRLFAKRKESFSPIQGRSSYIRTSIRNIAIDLYRSTIRHSNPNILGERQRVLSLEAIQADGRSLLDRIAVEESDTEENAIWNQLSQIECSLEKELYYTEIEQVEHRTPKGRATFLEMARLFSSYRDRNYTPTGNEYKKFDRQRIKMSEYLHQRSQFLLKQFPDVAHQLKELKEKSNFDRLVEEATPDDREAKIRTLQKNLDLIALLQYCPSGHWDRQDGTTQVLLARAKYSLFQSQLYRTKRKKSERN